MAYSIAKLKRSDNKASPCFKPFLIRNMPDRFAYPHSAVRFNNTRFHYPFQCHGDTKTSHHISQDIPPNWIISILEVNKQLMHCSTVYSFFPSSIWWKHNIWPAADLLLPPNPHWRCTIISFAYAVNLDSRMFYSLLYLSDKRNV